VFEENKSWDWSKNYQKKDNNDASSDIDDIEETNSAEINEPTHPEKTLKANETPNETPQVTPEAT
jgi:hypothetical protein